jgi:crotonobetainyl-CoA:carnitine CoA-transferase CaiB-like acyl-CoA transferase
MRKPSATDPALGNAAFATLAGDPRILTVADRSRKNSALTSAITAALAVEDVAVWVERLRTSGVPITPVAGFEQAVVADAMLQGGAAVAEATR